MTLVFEFSLTAIIILKEKVKDVNKVKKENK